MWANEQTSMATRSPKASSHAPNTQIRRAAIFDDAGRVEDSMHAAR